MTSRALSNLVIINQRGMNTLSGRILISHAIFIFILIVVSLITFNYLQQGTAIRNLQSGFFLTNSKMLSLVNHDMMIRGDEFKKPDFYQDKPLGKIQNRDNKLAEIIKDLDSFTHDGVIDDFGIQNDVNDIISEIKKYDRQHQRLLALQKIRGFKDFGFEGKMRSYAHQLENHSNQIALSQVLTLRRHEKDYFMRNDTVYVGLLNKLASQLKKSLLQPNSSKANNLYDLVDNYQGTFEEIVKIERAMGNESSGLSMEINQSTASVTSAFESISKLVDIKAQVLINDLIKKYLMVVGGGIILSLILGHFSAAFVTKSIHNLVFSIEVARSTGYETPSWKPDRLATHETKSLYDSYTTLLSTIRNQLDELELKTRKLSMQNEELIQINELLETSQKSLEESNQLKDKFFSIIGHDLRGPMANMTMSLRLLAESMDTMSKEDMSVFAANILSSADAISVLLDNLLVWAKTQTDSPIPQFENFKLREVVQNIQSLQAQRLNDKSIQLINELDEGLEISADRNMIDLVFRNLLDNAIKFTRESGFIKVSSKISKNYLRIMISDNGVGIEPEVQSTLFTSLVKKHSQGTKGEKGTGIGLMLAYDFIRKHGGKLQVTSELNLGSTFIISLPTRYISRVKAVEVA